MSKPQKCPHHPRNHHQSAHQTVSWPWLVQEQSKTKTKHKLAKNATDHPDDGTLQAIPEITATTHSAWDRKRRAGIVNLTGERKSFSKKDNERKGRGRRSQG
jgi:hypothetical protein